MSENEEKFKSNSEMFWLGLDMLKNSVEEFSAMISCWEWRSETEYKPLLRDIKNGNDSL